MSSNINTYTMKNMKQIVAVILFYAGCSLVVWAQVQDLSKMPEIQRNAMLISIAKEVVLLYGPDYYREVSEPIVELRELRPGYGHYFYYVTFPYDKTQETLVDYAAEVQICVDTGRPAGIDFGNGIGRSLPVERGDWRNGPPAHIGVHPYQDMTKPIYYNDNIIEIVIPVAIAEDSIKREAYYQQELLKYDREPLNKDDLLQRGWERRSDGEWVKVHPGVPPHKRVKVPR
jgi:hypothetical protein